MLFANLICFLQRTTFTEGWLVERQEQTGRFNTNRIKRQKKMCLIVLIALALCVRLNSALCHFPFLISLIGKRERKCTLYFVLKDKLTRTEKKALI